jgi:DNA-binding GntR family transcriptional regulator
MLCYIQVVYSLYTARKKFIGRPEKVIEFAMSRGIQQLEQYLENHKSDYEANAMLLRELAYKRLYDALRNTDLDDGEPLPENQLSRILGISRTPVREALQQLASDGIVQVTQGRITTTTARSAQEVFDALHVRELLEPLSVRLCAGAISMGDLQRLQHLTQQMTEAAHQADRNVWLKVDRQWHEVLCAACPNKLLGQMVLQARNRMHHKGADELTSEQYLIDGTQEHRAIVEALIRQDGEQAERIMHQHLGTLRENILSRFIKRYG